MQMKGGQSGTKGVGNQRCRGFGVSTLSAIRPALLCRLAPTCKQDTGHLINTWPTLQNEDNQIRTLYSTCQQMHSLLSGLPQ